MNHPATSRAIVEPPLARRTADCRDCPGLDCWRLVTPLALPLAVSGLVFVLAALRFKPLLPLVVFFLPVTPFLNWDFPIRDLSTLVRFSLFAGVLLYRVTHHR